ncbi:MAG: alfa-L-rhamnosidase [Ruminococcaceae bacterium]|nr:alfa-L-rhamnosidase [Oscillospiraceae bacterium]
MRFAKWISAPVKNDGSAVVFKKRFRDDGVVSALIKISGLGIYCAHINGKKIGRQVLTPGWTSYTYRVQYQTVDVTDLLEEDNLIEIGVGPGWAIGRMGYHGDASLYADRVCTVAEIELTYDDGRVEYIYTDESWDTYSSEVTFSDIYDGETIDKTAEPVCYGKAIFSAYQFNAIEQVGADIVENEIIKPARLIVTPKGERVIDFGQNMTGYVSLKIKGQKGERVVISHAEVLDKEGNFYTGNYRSAKNILTFVLSGEEDCFKPTYSFQGFRYIRLDEFPNADVDLRAFSAIVVHSDMERTGYFTCGDEKINQLYHNIIWGHKSNYLDIPTDCPQRDERLGWTGDTQVFCRTAGINYDVRKFFRKWLGELRLEQEENGAVRGVCPEKFGNGYHTRISAGWGDVATIAPMTLYELYGDESFLSENFELMRRWVEYQHSAGPEEFLWLGGVHYGDWLAHDSGEDSYEGATSADLIASAFFYHSTELLVRAGEILGRDVEEYKTLAANVKRRFREFFMENGMPKGDASNLGKPLKNEDRHGMTQTAITLILHFGLCEESERAALADKLVELIALFGNRMSTGFLGTPYILHALSDSGKQDVAYKLFFNEDNPSWLYSVNNGATTMWEHWNSVKEDGSFWSDAMNSFNHYAYGCVADWMYGKICGVEIAEDGAGYSKITLTPRPCRRLGFAKCAIDTVRGRVKSAWYYTGERINFEFTVPAGTEALITLPDGYTEKVGGGSYCYSVAAN